jgi:hypothetical protein
MPLSWNEIKIRASQFSKEWENTSREEAEAQPFLIEFLNIFGITRRRVATFEHKIKKADAHSGYIDLLWKGMLLVEMKSRGEDMEKAYDQAKEYCHGLKEHELPKFIMICDFRTFHLYDEYGVKIEFELPKLINHVRHFGDIAGYQQHSFKEQDPVNIKAAVLMGKLHDKLKEIGYTGHHLELYLVRLLFILFADDTNIFDRGIFQDYLMQRTADDGSDLAQHLDGLFGVLNIHESKRLKIIDEQLNAFPYVNGKLFEERLPLAAFDSAMRKILIDSGTLDWGQISPAIFGSLFQSVMNEKERRNLGAHYTSEKNIMKVIKPLFLDDLWQEFTDTGRNKNKLSKLHEKISKLRFLDPACGCGNFLIISYRELRILELEIVKGLLGGQTVTNISHYFLVDVDQFYGIEYEEFPSQIAQVAMWLIDHQMNMLASEAFGEYLPRIPLKKSPVIKHGNALHIDWQSLIQPLPQDVGQPTYNYIFGNPPFIGKQLQSKSQREDMEMIFSRVKGAGVLDYVTSWYIKASKYMLENIPLGNPLVGTQVAFVSTNSICQGEQVGLLWTELFNKYKIKILFAHTTFKWSNEAKGIAAVYVIIVGFSNIDRTRKKIFSYTDIKGEPNETSASNINPYLIEGRDFALNSRSKPINNVPEVFKGNQPTEGGHLFLTEDERKEYLKAEPGGKKYIKAVVSGREYLIGEKRYCFWLVDASPSELRSLPLLMKRVSAVREMRLESTFGDTRDLADTPTLFRDLKNPSKFIVIPATTSENRMYIPFGFFTATHIPINSVYIIPDATLYHYGILQSIMHMSWVRYTCGRLESRYRYSKDIVYNNYPWPLSPTEKQKQAVEVAAQVVLDTRALFPESSLADLYDPTAMPRALVKAHQVLDKAVDQCYRSQPFLTEAKRIEYLFELYDTYTSGLFPAEKKGRKKSK